MSFRRPEMHFQDILKAICPIEEFVGEVDFAAYLNGVKTRAAVERELQIVTEAAYRLKPEDDALCPGTDWRRIRGMRNIYRGTPTTATTTRRCGTQSKTIFLL